MSSGGRPGRQADRQASSRQAETQASERAGKHLGFRGAAAAAGCDDGGCGDDCCLLRRGVTRARSEVLRARVRALWVVTALAAVTPHACTVRCCARGAGHVLVTASAATAATAAAALTAATAAADYGCGGDGGGGCGIKRRQPRRRWRRRWGAHRALAPGGRGAPAAPTPAHAAPPAATPSTVLLVCPVRRAVAVIFLYVLTWAAFSSPVRAPAAPAAAAKPLHKWRASCGADGALPIARGRALPDARASADAVTAGGSRLAAVLPHVHCSAGRRRCERPPLARRPPWRLRNPSLACWGLWERGF